jgi:dCTP deaminase
MLSNIPPGVIVDEQLTTLCENGELITQEFAPGNIRQACYELRASDVFYETYSSLEDKRVVADSSGYIIRPSSYATVIVLETLICPTMCLQES